MKKLKFGSKAYREKYLHHGKKSKTKIGRVRHMAKKKHYSSSGNKSLPLWAKTLVSSVVATGYGAFRGDIAKVLPDIPKMENYSDEAIIGGGALLAQLVLPRKIGKYTDMATAPIIANELARVGAKMRLKTPLSNGGSSSTQTSSGQLPLY